MSPTNNQFRQRGCIHEEFYNPPCLESFSLNTDGVLPRGQKCSFAFLAGLNPGLRTGTVLLDPLAGRRKTPKDGFKPLPTPTVLHLARSPATTRKPRALG